MKVIIIGGVFMGAGDIQLYERSFEELLASLQTHM